MRYILLIATICSLIILPSVSSAAPKPKPATVSMFNMIENNYPCAKVEFPDQIKLLKTTTKKQKKSGDIGIVYDLEMPGYKIQVVKMYAGKNGWSIDSLASLKPEASKLYEIGDDQAADKSAVITAEIINGELYLKGSIAEFQQNDRAIRIDVFRRIKKVGTFKMDVINTWKNSTTGTKTIANLKNIVDYIYMNVESTECKYKETIDMEFK